MNDINTITISGNLVADPQGFADGTVARFSLASNRSYRKNGETEWTEEATFVDVSCFNGIAKQALAKLRKDDKHKITVTGRLELNKWQAEDDSNRQQLRIVATGLVSESLFKRSDEQPPSPSEVAATETTDAPEAEAVEETVAETTGESIPF